MQLLASLAHDPTTCDTLLRLIATSGRVVRRLVVRTEQVAVVDKSSKECFACGRAPTLGGGSDWQDGTRNRCASENGCGHHGDDVTADVTLPHGNRLVRLLLRQLAVQQLPVGGECCHSGRGRKSSGNTYPRRHTGEFLPRTNRHTLQTTAATVVPFAINDAMHRIPPLT